MRLSCILVVTSVVYFCGALPLDTGEKVKLPNSLSEIDISLLDNFAEYMMKGKSGGRSHRSKSSSSSSKSSSSPSTLRRQHSGSGSHYNGSNRPSNFRNLDSNGSNRPSSLRNLEIVRNIAANGASGSGSGTGTSLSNSYLELQRQKEINIRQQMQIEELQKELQIQRHRYNNFNQIPSPYAKPSLHHEMSFVPIRQSQNLLREQQAQGSINIPIAIPGIPTGKYNGKDEAPPAPAEPDYGIFSRMAKWYEAGKTIVTLPMGLLGMVTEFARYLDRSEMVENIKDGIVYRIFGGESENPFTQ